MRNRLAICSYLKRELPQLSTPVSLVSSCLVSSWVALRQAASISVPIGRVKVARGPRARGPRGCELVQLGGHRADLRLAQPGDAEEAADFPPAGSRPQPTRCRRLASRQHADPFSQEFPAQWDEGSVWPSLPPYSLYGECRQACLRHCRADPKPVAIKATAASRITTL